MASATPHTIVLRGEPIVKEALAGEAFTPGHILERTSTGTLLKTNTGATNRATRVALESAQIGDTIDTAYAADDTVPFAVLRSGDEFYGWLEDGQSVSLGDQLEQTNDGTVTALASGVAKYTALEDVAASGANARIRLEVN